MLSHGDNVPQQFDPRAQAYLHSPVHAHGPPDLAQTSSLIAGPVRPQDPAAGK